MKYTFESPEKTLLLETNDVKELNEYIFNNIGELTLIDIAETFPLHSHDISWIYFDDFEIIP